MIDLALDGCIGQDLCRLLKEAKERARDSVARDAFVMPMEDVGRRLQT